MIRSRTQHACRTEHVRSAAAQNQRQYNVRMYTRLCCHPFAHCRWTLPLLKIGMFDSGAGQLHSRKSNEVRRSDNGFTYRHVASINSNNARPSQDHHLVTTSCSALPEAVTNAHQCAGQTAL